MPTGAAGTRGRAARQSSLRLERVTLQAIFMLALVAVSPTAAHGVEQLGILTQPGPWSAISGLIGYGSRLWFANSSTDRPYRAEKYLAPAPAAAWAAAELRQADDATLEALITRLGATDSPRCLDGDFVGGLTAVTGQRFGYELAAWRDWWMRHSPWGRSTPGQMLPIPRGTLLMGSDQGTPDERPVHRVTISAFSIDRFEVTNAEFAAFVSSTGYVADPERAGVGWDWDGDWREVRGADWRHPHGLGSSPEGLEHHPVVQVSWRDANAYCR
jgi:formylglycine-generating enzyme required for sulfatase activity